MSEKDFVWFHWKGILKLDCDFHDCVMCNFVSFLGLLFRYLQLAHS